MTPPRLLQVEARVDPMEITTDPARWPFCEARARAAAASVAFPDPIPVGGRPFRWRAKRARPTRNTT